MFLINTKQSVVYIVINGFTSNVTTWMTLITNFHNPRMKIGIAYYTAPKFFHFVKLMKNVHLQRNLNKPTDTLVNLMNKFNNLTDDGKKNESNLPNCKYRDTDHFKNLTKDFKRKALFFHMNVCSLADDFNILLSELNVSFDILAITETRIKKDSLSPINLWLNNYSTDHTPTNLSAGGTLLYISKLLSYQLRNDLRLWPRKIWSSFI